jgi:hypothetical protein
MRVFAGDCSGLAEHELTQPVDELGFLGNLNDLRRRDIAQGRMSPPEQRLDSGHLAIGRDLRLIVNGDPVAALQRRSKIPLKPVAPPQLLVEFVRKEAKAASSAPLRFIKRKIRGPYIIVGTGQMLVGNNGPDARRHAQLQRTELVGDLQIGANPLA